MEPSSHVKIMGSRSKWPGFWMFVTSLDSPKDAYIYIYTFTYVYRHIHTFIYIYKYIYTYVYLYIYIYTLCIYLNIQLHFTIVPVSHPFQPSFSGSAFAAVRTLPERIAVGECLDSEAGDVSLYRSKIVSILEQKNWLLYYYLVVRREP